MPRTAICVFAIICYLPFFLSLALRFALQSSHMLPLWRINTSAAVKDTQALLLRTYVRLGARDPDEKI